MNTFPLTTSEPIAPGGIGLVSLRAEKSGLLTEVIPVAPAVVQSVVAGAISRAVVGTDPSAVMTALGDGITIPAGITIALMLSNSGAEPTVLSATLGLVTMPGEGEPVKSFAEVAVPVAPPAFTPTPAVVGVAPIQPPVASGAAWTNGGSRVAQAALPVPGNPQAIDDGSLRPTANSGSMQHYAPIVRDKDDPRPPPAKMATNGFGGGRSTRVGYSQGGSYAQAPQGRVNGSMKMYPPVVGEAGQSALPPSAARATTRVQDVPQRVAPAVRARTVVQGANPEGLAPAFPGAQASPEARESDVPIRHAFDPSQGRMVPIVVQHGVARAFYYLLERRTPMVRAHRDIMQGALGRASSLPPDIYANEEARLRSWNHGHAIVWIPSTCVAAVGRILATNGQGELPHDAIPAIVDGLRTALSAPQIQPQLISAPAEMLAAHGAPPAGP